MNVGRGKAWECKWVSTSNCGFVACARHNSHTCHNFTFSVKDNMKHVFYVPCSAKHKQVPLQNRQVIKSCGLISTNLLLLAWAFNFHGWKCQRPYINNLMGCARMWPWLNSKNLPRLWLVNLKGNMYTFWIFWKKGVNKTTKRTFLRRKIHLLFSFPS